MSNTNAMKIVAIYDVPKEKSVITVPGMSKDEVKTLFESVANTQGSMACLDLQSSKGDMLLVTLNHLVALYATPVNVDESDSTDYQ